MLCLKYLNPGGFDPITSACSLLEEFDLAASVRINPVLDSSEEHREDCWRANVDESRQALRVMLLTNVKEHFCQARVTIPASHNLSHSPIQLCIFTSWSLIIRLGIELTDVFASQ